MIFGLSDEGRAEVARRRTYWHTKFCWLPTGLIDGRTMWLGFAKRRLVQSVHGDYYEYKEIGKSAGYGGH